jgi:altronate dehydratase large subunit
VEVLGYTRADGSVGVRNHVLVLPLHASACTAAAAIAEQVDGAVTVSHDWDGSGSARDVERAGRVFAGFARHPNVYATVLIGLHSDDTEPLADDLTRRGRQVVATSLAANRGTTGTVEHMRPIAGRMTVDAAWQARQPVSVSALRVGLECGGSDALSGITANPALGVASDLVVADGGGSILAETSELLGAEHLLAARARTPEIGAALVEMITRFEREVAALGVDLLGGQPVPGNIAGGLTTIEEKSLGAAKKGGSATIEGVLDFAEEPDGPGLYVMDTPGNDIEQMVGMVAGGCQVVAFTTGRGTPTGSPIAPCLKISTNTDMYERLPGDIDVDAGTVLSRNRTLGEVGAEIYAALLEAANGALTAAERHGDRQFAISRLDPDER